MLTRVTGNICQCLNNKWLSVVSLAMITSNTHATGFISNLFNSFHRICDFKACVRKLYSSTANHHIHLYYCIHESHKTFQEDVTSHLKIKSNNFSYFALRKSFTAFL